MNCDVIMMMLKKILEIRNDLRIIITSATINAREFRDFFTKNESKDSVQESCIISVNKRANEVDIYYSNIPVYDYIKSAYDTILSIHKKESINKGDILVFFPTVGDIMQLIAMLNQLKSQKHIKIDVILRMFDSFEMVKNILFHWNFLKESRLYRIEI